MDKDEKSLLLFFEDMAVNQWGWIDNPLKLNEVDIEIGKKWNESGFCLFKRASKMRGETTILTYIVKLSDEAWSIAHELRKARALRHIPEQFESQDKGGE